jgi:hypothetical protein
MAQPLIDLLILKLKLVVTIKIINISSRQSRTYKGSIEHIPIKYKKSLFIITDRFFRLTLSAAMYMAQPLISTDHNNQFS